MSKEKDKRSELMKRRSGETLPRKTGEFWSEDEKKFLLHMYYEGEDISDIALLLERSETSIFEQLKNIASITPIESRRGSYTCKWNCRCRTCKLKGTPECPRYKGGR